jgi:putative restriction endonuclease
MAFWWVNHKQTRDHEISGGYLWSPYRNANGAFNQTYDNMRHTQVGDVVFSFAHAQIGAVGRVTATAAASPKPIEFGIVGDYWANEGWLVEIDFVPVPKTLRPQAYSQLIAPLLPARHSPIQPSGRGNQGCYLAGISDALGLVLLELMDAATLLPSASRIGEPEHGPALLEDLHQIEGDLSIPETQKLQLAKARIGQGLFRKRVILLDPACRVTGVTETRVLIASHIKPWKSSSNAERINGFNGIMLSPHVDALFDDHLITFEDDGRMRVHESLPPDVLERWGVDPGRKVERFRPEQATFLSQHRDVFGAKLG